MSRQPLSVDELLKRKREQQASESKPRFLSKAERQKRALEQRHAEVAKQKTQVQVSTNHNSETRHNSQAQHIPTKRAELPKKAHGGSKMAMRIEDRFKFEWGAEDDTLDPEDSLYNPSKRKIDLPGQGGGWEERQRRARELEELKTKRVKVDWDEVPWRQKPLDYMKERDWRIFRDEFSIVTRGGNIPPPLRSWSESKIPEPILKTIESLGYKEPTPIQRAAIPIALGNRDVIGVAETGSGKTASFIIPLLTYIMELPPLTDLTKAEGPYAVILAPTRELAQQIETEAVKFSEPMGFRCASLVGGRNIEEQAYKLQEGAEIVIATPGRLLDCLEQRYLVLNQCCYVVMDEADRMIDLGFEEQISKILAALPVTNEKPADESLLASDGTVAGKQRYRQTMMYTATWPRAIERMADKYLRLPGIVTIGTIGQATDRVQQRVEYISNEEKRTKRLLEILNNFKPPIIIFVNLRRSCDFLAKQLNDAGWKTSTMYGNKSQEQREAALAQLKSGAADCLVATDVAGRGIDVQDVSLVVNYQMSKTIESYTHRIGRTGRAGKKGTAITFVGPGDEDVFYDLKVMLQNSNSSGGIPEELRRAIRPVVRKAPQESTE